jgi:hypothetical protein
MDFNDSQNMLCVVLRRGVCDLRDWAICSKGEKWSMKLLRGVGRQKLRPSDRRKDSLVESVWLERLSS